MNKNIFERIRLYKINFKRMKLQKEKNKVKAKKFKVVYLKKQSKIKIFFKFIIGFFLSIFEYLANKSNKKNFSKENNKIEKKSNRLKNVKSYDKTNEVVNNYNLIKEKEKKINENVKDDEKKCKDAKVELSIIEDQLIYANNVDDLNKVMNKIYVLKGSFNIENIKKSSALIDDYKTDFDKYNSYNKDIKLENNNDLEKKLQLSLKNEMESLKVLKRIDEDVELVNLKKNYLVQEEKLAEQISKSNNEDFIEEDFVQVKKIGALINNYVNTNDKFDDNLVEFDQDKLLFEQDRKFDKKIIEKVDDNLDSVIEDNENKNSDFDLYVEKNIAGISTDSLEKSKSDDEKKVGNSDSLDKEKNKKPNPDYELDSGRRDYINGVIDSLNYDNSLIDDQIDNSNNYVDRLKYYLNNPEDALPFVDHLDIAFTRTLQGIVNVGAGIELTRGHVGVLAGSVLINQALNNHIRRVHDSGIEGSLNSMYNDSIRSIEDGKRLCEDSFSRISDIKDFVNSLPDSFKESKKYKSIMIKCVSIEKTNRMYYDRLNKALQKNGNLRILVNRNVNRT